MFVPVIIAEARQRCKTLLARVPRDTLLTLLLVLASILSFGLGYLAGKDAPQESPPAVTDAPAPADVRFVASKTGTRFYLPWCSGVARLSEANKVYFDTEEEARAAGYAPAANCSGL